MKCSVGRIDRVLRISVGLVLIGLAASSVIGAWGWSQPEVVRSNLK